MFLSLPVLPCRTCTNYVDLCLLLTDYILSHFLPLPITLIPRFLLELALITSILCTQSPCERLPRQELSANQHYSTVRYLHIRGKLKANGCHSDSTQREDIWAKTWAG